MGTLPITTSTSDELFSCINIDDFERPWTFKIRGFIDFCNFRLQCTFQEWTATKWLEMDWQFANRNCYRLSRLLWTLAHISCIPTFLKKRRFLAHNLAMLDENFPRRRFSENFPTAKIWSGQLPFPVFAPSPSATTPLFSNTKMMWIVLSYDVARPSAARSVDADPLPLPVCQGKLQVKAAKQQPLLSRTFDYEQGRLGCVFLLLMTHRRSHLSAVVDVPPPRSQAIYKLNHRIVNACLCIKNRLHVFRAFSQPKNRLRHSGSLQHLPTLGLNSASNFDRSSECTAQDKFLATHALNALW